MAGAPGKEALFPQKNNVTHRCFFQFSERIGITGSKLHAVPDWR
jgi:hypothetical protein